MSKKHQLQQSIYLVLKHSREGSPGARCYVPKTNRALVNPDFSKVMDPHIYISMQLQRVFGLRVGR